MKKITYNDLDRVQFHLELIAKELYRARPLTLAAFIAFHGISRLHFDAFIDAVEGFERHLIGSNDFDAGVFEVIVTDELHIGAHYINDLVCALYHEKLFLNVVYEYVRKFPAPEFSFIPKPD